MSAIMKAAISELMTVLKQSLVSHISILKVENQLNKPDIPIIK